MMLATARCLPKWLLAAVAFCILLGQAQQWRCQISGCSAASTDASAQVAAHADSSSDHADGDCHCSCHLSTFALAEMAPAFVSLPARWAGTNTERNDHAPEAPRAEIEYPPQSV